MKKGFTLVEILTVIIILALVGVIAIPIVSNIISNSERETAEIYLQNVSSIAETYYRNEQMSGNIINSIDLTSNTLKHSGGKPEKGIAIFDENGEVFVKMYYNGYCLTKNYNGNILSEKISSDECKMEEYIYVGSPEECFNFDKATKTINKYDKNNPSCPMDVVIPNKIDDVEVEHIGSAAFIEPTLQLCVNNIEQTVTEVELNYVHTEGDGYDMCIFEGLTDTRSVTVLDLSNAKNLKTIGSSAFAYNQIQRIIFNDSLIEIGPTAFLSNNLVSLTLPNSLKKIDYGAFGLNQINSLNLSYLTNLTEIGSEAFIFNQIVSLTLPNSLVKIGDYSFEENYIQALTIPSSVSSIGEFAFAANNINTLVLPNKTMTIGNCAFVDNPLDNVTNSANLSYNICE